MAAARFWTADEIDRRLGGLSPDIAKGFVSACESELTARESDGRYKASEVRSFMRDMGQAMIDAAKPDRGES